MDFNKMSLSELTNELNRFRAQIENQGFPMTKAQRARWTALSKAYEKMSEYIAK